MKKCSKGTTLVEPRSGPPRRTLPRGKGSGSLIFLSTLEEIVINIQLLWVTAAKVWKRTKHFKVCDLKGMHGDELLDLMQRCKHD